MELEKIVKLLEENGLNPKYIDIDDVGFSRDIEFKTKYQKCWINWFKNYSSLRIGDRYGNEIYFDMIRIINTSPSNKLSLEFYMKIIDDKLGDSFNLPTGSYLVLDK